MIVTVNNIVEKELNPRKGFFMIPVGVLGILISILALCWCIFEKETLGAALTAVVLFVCVVMLLLFCICLCGLRIVRPNEALVLTLFGEYYGTIKKPGLFFVNPFSHAFSPEYNALKLEAKRNEQEANAKNEDIQFKAFSGDKTVSTKIRTLNNGKQKVNDVLGNPIIIGSIVIWRVDNPTQAVFSVENYAEFLSIQTDSIIRNIARRYPYDVFDDDNDEGVREKTLRGSSLEIAESMKAELSERVRSAGLVIEEVRITHLAYAEEIAAAMLQRQQAAAIIAARQKIVDGAVSMVKMAIDKLGQDEIVVLDEERKAAMVSNLLVVLCGNKDAQPVVNSGSIY